MKALQVYKFTFNNDFMMTRELNFIVTRNDFEQVVIWVSLLVSKLLSSSCRNEF